MEAAADSMHVIGIPNDVINLVRQRVIDTKIMAFGEFSGTDHVSHHKLTEIFSLSTGTERMFPIALPVGPPSFYSNADVFFAGGGTRLVACKNDSSRMASLNRSKRRVAPFASASEPFVSEWKDSCNVDPGSLSNGQMVNMCIGTDAVFAWADQSYGDHGSLRTWMMNAEYEYSAPVTNVGPGVCGLWNCCWVGDALVAIPLNTRHVSTVELLCLDVRRGQWRTERAAVDKGVAFPHAISPMDNNVCVAFAEHCIHSTVNGRVKTTTNDAIFFLKDVRVDAPVHHGKIRDVSWVYDMIAVPGTGGVSFLAADKSTVGASCASLYDFRNFGRSALGVFGNDKRFTCGMF